MQKLDAAKRHYKGGRIPAYVDIHADINSAQNLEAPVESATTITARGMIAQTTAAVHPLKCEGNLVRPPSPPGPGGPGKPGPPPKEFHWEALIKEGECDYEDWGTELLDPPGTVEIILKHRDGKIEYYNINVTPEGHYMKDVNAQVHSPEAGAMVPDPKGPRVDGKWHIKRALFPDTDCPKCEDLCFRYEIWRDPIKFILCYWIEMPRWLQLNKAGDAAKAEWNKFCDTLLAHELRHEKILTEYFNGDGKRALQDFAKEKYWAEGHDGYKATKVGNERYNNAFNAVLTKIFAEHNKLQEEFHKTPKGQPVPLPESDIPCW